MHDRESKAAGLDTHIWKAVDSIWRFFSSVRLAILLLVLLGLGSVVGTFLPQLPLNPGLTLEHLEAEYSPWLFFWLKTFQVFDLFHSWWFSLLLVALALNLIACSAPRIPILLKVMRGFPKTPGASGRYRRWLADWEQDSKQDLRLKRVQKILSVGLRKVEHSSPDKEWWLAEWGRWSRPGFLLVHLGVALVLVGGALSQVTAVEGTVALEPGQKADSFVSRGVDGGLTERRLGFELRCRDFFIERFGTGMAGIKDYVSQLEVLVDGKVRTSQRVEVNHPMSFGGYSFYQSSYQRVARGDRATLRVESDGESRTLELSPGEQIAKGTDGTVYRLKSYSENFRGLGQAIRVEMTMKSQKRREFWVMARYPGFVKANRPGGLGLDLLSYKPGLVTILSVSSDPGTPLVWIGSILLLLGLFAVFVGGHRKLWVRQTGSELELVCWAHRNLDVFAEKMSGRLESADGLAVRVSK